MPCTYHSLNLTLIDMTYACMKASKFFGIMQRIYTLFTKDGRL